MISRASAGFARIAATASASVDSRAAHLPAEPAGPSSPRVAGSSHRSGIVEHRRQAAGRHVIVDRLRHPEIRSVLVDIAKRRHHGEENADEKECDLLDWAEGEMILLVHELRVNFHEISAAPSMTISREKNTSGKKTAPIDDHEQQEVDPPLEPPRLPGLNLGCTARAPGGRPAGRSGKTSPEWLRPSRAIAQTPGPPARRTEYRANIPGKVADRQSGVSEPPQLETMKIKKTT